MKSNQSRQTGWGGGGGMNWEIGIDMYTLICIKEITKKQNSIRSQNLKKKKNRQSIMNSGVPIIQPQYPLICGLAPSIPPSTSSFCAIFEAY